MFTMKRYAVSTSAVLPGEDATLKTGVSIVKATCIEDAELSAATTFEKQDAPIAAGWRLHIASAAEIKDDTPASVIVGDNNKALSVEGSGNVVNY